MNKSSILFLAVCLVVGMNPLSAAPRGEQVTRGDVSIEHNGTLTSITASHRAIIHYQSFNVQAHEVVRFIQPSTNATVLIRVTDSDNPSQVLGSLQANGQVLLVNPAGVVFGDKATVDVGALSAAAGRINDQDYLAGLNHFSQSQGIVENHAALVGKLIQLNGKQVVNTGDIRASVITLDGGSEGTLEIAGTLDAVNSTAGETGGTVKVLGAEIGLLTGTEIDASGQAGGGEVFIGGGFQGENPDLHNATVTHVAEEVIIRADAITGGDGGTVIVWADRATSFHGLVSASGGVVAGNGGFVEISGKRSWVFPGWSRAVDVSAPLGTPGTFLIDPNDITIQAGLVGGTPIGSSPTNSNTLNDEDIINFLTNSGSLVIETTGTGGNGDITVNNDVDISWSTANDLTLDADRDITFSSGGTPNFSASGTGAITLEATRDITLNAGSDITTNDGEVQLLARGDITLGSNSSITTSTSEATLWADTDSNGSGTIVLADISANSLTVTAGGSITDNAGTTLAVTNQATFDAGANNITLGDDGSDTTNFGSLNVTGATVTITEDSATELAGSNVTTLNLTSNGAIAQSGLLTVSGATTFTES
ncbi:MAG: filamentous hemagglutinin N-terminal domain-containing protein, partial [Gammaproteobacteria bacterium]|nr:filamentous hemagglutinin N-terminal domain-containing protein [Gammaproteobacteria bacterium]